MPAALVIFDCDGVLVDTRAVECEVMSAVLARVGITMSPADFDRASHGLTDAETWLELARLFERDFPADTQQLYWLKVTEAWRARLQPVRGVRAVLERLRRAKRAVCVASGGSLAQMDVTLGVTGLKTYFGDKVFSSEQAGRSKPAPDVYLYAADRMGVKPGECIVIEDSVNGIRAALAARMEVIGFAPPGKHEDLRSLGVRTFQRMDDLPRLLGV